jgi:hypothetical protein
VGGEVGRAVPALQHGLDREPVALADGDEPALADERVDLGRFQAAVGDVHVHGVAGQEQVRGVAVELGTLMRSQGVFDSQLVQAELSGELVELQLRGGAQVHPHHGVGPLEVVGDLGDGEVLGLEDALAVRPGHGIAHDTLLHPSAAGFANAIGRWRSGSIYASRLPARRRELTTWPARNMCARAGRACVGDRCGGRSPDSGGMRQSLRSTPTVFRASGRTTAGSG